MEKSNRIMGGFGAVAFIALCHVIATAVCLPMVVALVPMFTMGFVLLRKWHESSFLQSTCGWLLIGTAVYALFATLQLVM